MGGSTPDFLPQIREFLTAELLFGCWGQRIGVIMNLTVDEFENRTWENDFFLPIQDFKAAALPMKSHS